MTKRFLYYIMLSLIVASCSAPDTEENTIKIKEEPKLISEDNGTYTEWYPGRKQIKIKGRKDNQGRREGIWKHFSPEGTVLSVTVYTAGKKDGHIVVRYPNNVVHYSGEYQMDERVGVWKFYNEQGELTKEEDFGYPN